MKINEIADVVQHPSMKRNTEYDALLGSDEPDVDAIIAFIMDDNNPQERRITLLRRLDQLLGDEQESYDASDLESFMHDQGPSDWKADFRKNLEKFSANTDYPWSKKHPPGSQYDFSQLDSLSDEEADQLARDLGFPPYHIKPVEEETFSSDSDIPTGEYEICDKCFGDGCPECEEGLVDVTGTFKAPNFDDLI